MNSQSEKVIKKIKSKKRSWASMIQIPEWEKLWKKKCSPWLCSENKQKKLIANFFDLENENHFCHYAFFFLFHSPHFRNVQCACVHFLRCYRHNHWLFTHWVWNHAKRTSMDQHIFVWRRPCFCGDIRQLVFGHAEVSRTRYHGYFCLLMVHKRENMKFHYTPVYG